MNYKDVSDYELLYLIEDEDECYINILFDKYMPVINSICKKYNVLFECKKIDYDEVHQEAMIAFYDAIRSFSSQKNVVFYSYVVVCIENRLKDYIRKIYRNKYTMLENAISLDYEIGDNIVLEDILLSNSDIWQSIVLSDVFEKLIEFKNTLTDREAQVFELRMNGFSYNEISTLLDIKSKNIYSYIKQIRRKVKKSSIVDCFF